MYLCMSRGLSVSCHLWTILRLLSEIGKLTFLMYRFSLILFRSRLACHCLPLISHNFLIIFAVFDLIRIQSLIPSLFYPFSAACRF